MNIAQIRELDVGMKSITCSGKVTWAGETKNIVGTSDSGNDYDFWSQFIVIKDNANDKIGISITIEEGQRSPKKGDMVTIEKAELQEYYNKDNEPTLKLQGKLQDTSQGSPQAPQNQQQAPSQPAQPTTNYQNPAPQGKKEPDWDAIAEGKVRHGILCAMLQGGIQVDYDEVLRHTIFVMTGKDPNAYPNPDPEITNQGICGHCGRPHPDCICNPPF